MSFYGQSQSFYSQQGWLYLGSRSAPPRETFALPFAQTSGTAHSLAAVEAGSSSDTAALVLALRLALSDAGNSSDAASLTMALQLGATDAGLSTDAANLIASLVLGVTDAGTSTDSADLSADLRLAAVDAGGSTALADLIATRALEVLSAGGSSDSATLELLGDVVYVDTLTPGHIEWSPDPVLTDASTGRIANPSAGRLS